MDERETKKLEKYKKGELNVDDHQDKQKKLDDALLSAVGRAELLGENVAQIAKKKTQQIREAKKKQALEEIKKEEEKIKKMKIQKVEFGEYQPKFKDSIFFKFLMLFLVLAFIGAGVGAYFIISNWGKEKPKAISISATQFYYSDGEDFTLTAWLNADYEGNDKKIKVSVVAGNGIVTLEKAEVESGKPFKVKVVKNGVYAVGGKVRICVEDSATGKQKTYCDVTIDTPITDIDFNNDITEKYIYQTLDVGANAKTGSSVNDISTVLGKNISYNLFVTQSGGDYVAVLDGSTIKSFREVEVGEIGEYSLIAENVEDVSKLSGTALTALKKGTVYVQASASKWLSHNTDKTLIKSVRKVENKLIPLTITSFNDLYTSGSSVVPSNNLYTLSFDSIVADNDISSTVSEFSKSELKSMLQYCTTNNENVSVTETGFVFDFSDVDNITVEFSYDYDGEEEHIITFTLDLDEHIV